MPTLPPEQLARLSALLDQMRLQSRGSSWSRAKDYVTSQMDDFRWGDRFIPKHQDRPNFFTRRNISQKRMAELNEKIRAEKAATQQRPVTRSRGPVTVQERIQPGTQRSSKRFQGKGHSRFGRFGGTPLFYTLDEMFTGKRGFRPNTRFPRKRNLSEVYTQGSGLLA